MSETGDSSVSPGPRKVKRVFRKISLVQVPAQPGISSTLTLDSNQPTDVATPHSAIGALQAELDATASVNTNLAATVARLQAELDATASVNTNLAASVVRLQAELDSTTSVNKHLAATVARLQAEQALPTRATTTPSAAPAPTTTTSTPTPCSYPDHSRTIASGRGAASPEVFRKITKVNWHGRLGRTHMAEVDALPTAALTELDSLLRRKLHELYPRGGGCSPPQADTIFASLAALGLRLEDRSAYADLPDFHDGEKKDAATLWRGRHFAGWYYSRSSRYVEYWKGSAVETLLELAKYRGLFDDEGFLI